MTMTLINKTGRMKVYNLPHKTYCAALGKCACTLLPGRNSARVCASLTLPADAEVEASVKDYRDVLVTLYAEVATNYVNVRELQERLRLAHENVEGQENTLTLTGDRFDSGLVSALDVAQAESNLANTRSLIPNLERRLALALRSSWRRCFLPPPATHGPAPGSVRRGPVHAMPRASTSRRPGWR